MGELIFIPETIFFLEKTVKFPRPNFLNVENTSYQFNMSLSLSFLSSISKILLGRELYHESVKKVEHQGPKYLFYNHKFSIEPFMGPYTHKFHKKLS